MDHSGFGSFNSARELQVNTTDNLLTFTHDYTGAEANTVMITPPSGKSIEVHGVYISSDNTNTDTHIDFSGGVLVFKLYVNTFTSSASPVMHVTGGVDETVRITCPADTFVIVTYHVV